MKIKDINPNQTISLKARVLNKEQEKSISNNRRSMLRVCSYTIGDETGLVNLNLFNTDIDAMEGQIGNVIEITSGWAKSYQGKIQVSMGKYGTWKKIMDPQFPSKLEILETEDEREEQEEEQDEEDPDKEAPVLKVNQILPDMVISTTVRVCDKQNIKYLKYKSGRRLRVRSFLLGDETGMIPYSAFNEEIDTLGKAMGKVIELKNCWSKFWKSSLQLSKGKRGTWEIIEEPKFIKSDELLGNYNLTQLEAVEQLIPGMVYFSEIVGIKYQSKGKEIYDKKEATELSLIPEPENQYDNKAVAVWLKDKKVGYIPRKHNTAIFKALKDGIPELKCLLGIYVPELDSKYCIPHRLKNVPITISTIPQEIEWRPVILYPEDLMAF